MNYKLHPSWGRVVVVQMENMTEPLCVLQQRFWTGCRVLMTLIKRNLRVGSLKSLAQNHWLCVTLICDKSKKWVRSLTLTDTGYCTLLEIVNILLHMAIKGQHTVLQRSRLCLNDICCIYQFCPPAKSKRNNTTAIAISWVMLSSQDGLNSGLGRREGWTPSRCWNQNFHVGNPMLMKTLSLAGGWCWYPFSAVPRISHTSALFALLSLRFLLRLCRKSTSNGADYTFHPAWHSFVLRFFSSSLCINIKRLIWYKRSKTPNSLFPTSLSSSLSSALCLLWDLR